MAEDLTRRLKIYINGTEVDATITNLRKNLAKFRAQANAAVEGTDNWKKYNAEVARTEIELKQAYEAQKQFKNETLQSDKGLSNMQKNLKSTSGLFSNLKKTLGDVFFPVSGALLFTDAIKGGIRYVKEFITDAVQLSIEAKGVEFAFKRLGDVGEAAFLKVKESTRGLLSDLEIKRSLVEFDNFNISLEESATLFEFLTIRAQQTGQSMDYLKQSMVEGLSKESKLRIDNLGISAAILNEELKKTPNFVQAVANIAKTEIVRAGNILDEATNSNQRWNATLENSKLRIGNLINNSGVIPFFQKMGSAILKAVIPTESLTKATEKQRINLLLIESKIKDVNTTNEDRIRIIKDLKAQYPTLLANIDAETVTNTELSAAIRSVNDQLVNKIILQRKDEEIEKQNEITANKRIKLIEQEDKVRERLVKLAVKEGITIKDNASLLEQSQDFLRKAGRQDGGRLINPIVDFSFQVNQLQESQKRLNIEDKTGNKLLEEKNKLLTRLNISPDVLTPTKAAPERIITTPEAEITDDEKKAAEKAKAEKEKAVADALAKKQAVIDALKQFDEEQKITETLAKLEEDQRAEEEEVIRLENKFIKLREDAQGETTLLTELEEAQAFQLQQIRDKHAEIRTKKEKETQDKILAQDKAYRQESINAERNLQEARANAKLAGLGMLSNIFGKEKALGMAAFAFEKGFAIASILKANAEANAKIGASLAIANSIAVAASPLTLGQPFVAINSANALKNTTANNINTAVQIGTIAATAIKGSFAQGGETFSGSYNGGVDGIGGQPAIVHPNEYIIPAYVRKDPEVPRIIDYLEAKRTGTQTTSSDSSVIPSNNNTDAVMIALTNAVNKLVDEGVKASTIYTLNDERKRRELADKLDNTIKSSKE